MAAEKQWTVLDLLNWTTEYFARKKIASPRLDAELLLAHALDRDRMWLYLHFNDPVPPEERARFRELVRLRAERVPVAYLTGEREFFSRSFRVTPAVLIPRPETEVLVEVVLREACGRFSEEPLALMEVGTGSGAVTITLALELGLERIATLVATDRSPEALEVARANGERYGLEDRIVFRAGDLLEVVLPDERFHGIVSNPPYVPTDVLATLEPEVSQYEPRLALDGGPDGLEVVRRLVDEAPEALVPGGWLAMELGPDQAEVVLGLMQDRGFREVRLFPDYAGRPRVVLGFWPEGS